VRRCIAVAYNISAGKAKTVKANVTRKGRKAISARRRHRVTVVLTPRGGRPSVSRKLTLRR
jgi:hypothetical protein